MILCCGEALIDMIPDQTASGDGCMVPKSGGAVFNTAIALGRLGVDAGLFTGVSDDMFGRQLKGELISSGVDCTHLVTLDAPTSLAFVELTDGQAVYSFYTKGAADTVLEPAHAPQGLGGLQAMFFGGISLCTDPTASTLAALQDRAALADIVTMIDPNIRPSFIRDEAAYRARISAMMQRADIVKLSDEDLLWTARSEGSMAAQIASLNLPDETIALITQGGDGAVAYRAGEVVTTVTSVPTNVADTIGAGDTFNAGFLASLSEQGLLDRTSLRKCNAAAIETAMAFAARCASITVSRNGANPPWVDELA